MASIKAISKAGGLTTTFTLGLVLTPIILIVSKGKATPARHSLLTAVLSRSIRSFIFLMLMFYGTDPGATIAFSYIANYLACIFRVGSYTYLYLKIKAVLDKPYCYIAMLGCAIDLLHDLVYRGMITVKLTPTGLVKSDVSGSVPGLKISHECIGIFLVVWYQAFFMYGIRGWASASSMFGNNDTMQKMKESSFIFTFIICLCRFLDAIFSLSKAYSPNSIIDVSELFHQLWLIVLVLDFVFIKEGVSFAQSSSEAKNTAKGSSISKTAEIASTNA